MLALRGVGVLVTRPERQAAPLCLLLEAAGASVIRFPLLEIVACVPHEPSGGGNPVEDFDLAIFTSANAVTFGASLLGTDRSRTIAAIGTATARALEERGYSPLTSTPGFDSEHLLAQPMLRQCAGRRILIVTGQHGRELLREELVARGAQVVLAEVYRRERLNHPPASIAALAAHFVANEIAVITVTSVEIAKSLLELPQTSPHQYSLRQAYERVPWVVPSARVASALREVGLTAPLLRADSAHDQDLVGAIARWRCSVSGA